MLRASGNHTKWYRWFRGWSIYFVFYWRRRSSLFVGVFAKQDSCFCRGLPNFPLDFLIRIDVTLFLADYFGFLFLSGRCGMQCFPFKFWLICGIILFAFQRRGCQNSGTSRCLDINRSGLLSRDWFDRCDFYLGLFWITLLCYWGFLGWWFLIWGALYQYCLLSSCKPFWRSDLL